MLEDGRMADGVLSLFVHPRIQACLVVIMDFFVVDRLMIQPDGVGSPTVECFTWFERCLDIEVGDEGGHVGIVLLESCPLTLPYFDNPVPAGQ